MGDYRRPVSPRPRAARGNLNSHLVEDLFKSRSNVALKARPTCAEYAAQLLCRAEVTMAKSRRHFLATTSLGLLGAAAALDTHAQNPGDQNPSQQPSTQAPPPGTPPAFGTGPLVGPEGSSATFAEAEKLVQIELTEAERAVAASSWRGNLAPLY